MHTSFPLPVTHLDGCAVLTLPAEIDLANAPAVMGNLLALLDRGHPGVVVDMTGTSCCAAAGVNAIVHALTRAHALGAWVRLVIPSPHVRKVFAVTAVDRLIQVYPTVDDALPHAHGGAEDVATTDR